MAHVRQQLFRYYYDFVVVKPIRLTSTSVLEPGTLVDKTMFRRYQIKTWYRRRRIGVVDSDWANAMLSDKNNSRASPEITGELKPILPDVLENEIIIGDDIKSLSDIVSDFIESSDNIDIRVWNSLDVSQHIQLLTEYVNSVNKRYVQKLLEGIERVEGKWRILNVDGEFATRREAETYIREQNGIEVMDSKESSLGASETDKRDNS